MKILQQSKNGTITLCEKTFEELSTEELKQLVFISGTSKKDYKTYKVHRNKKNEIIRVVAFKFSDLKTKEIEENSKKRNILDLCSIAFGKKQSKTYQKARKKFTNEEVKFIKNKFSV